ncbi:DUF2997 domain-containing protein [Schlesneria sp. T3-172]|uniref:DUF2997 domain-containing protein n=1 Tax=Schlesneria sphaerica TaxID=3373610 RepID=UPI0037C69784
MSQIIEITVSPKGETTLQTKGFTGESCRQASRQLEAALGLRLTERLTSECHSAVEYQSTVRQ